ncbi:pilus assembly protein N-terminal domain-containing protein [Chenggangzhangella methanolivorans]|uniref:Pilus assembly protein N-terminal domain-containing protein n=1 Tax=Chenggangzhangella methanolivorans TaxID=1437009 RepID=A0A9E6RC27_9HYPH|nr:pilus assembly protein N-terminal domain-containing protein [Chenggangzhangella methanolivorans]QZO01585.1 pilus assembly protein N-terminal domain-containing protein [Chenggangzhangella methanolivorans]
MATLLRTSVWSAAVLSVLLLTPAKAVEAPEPGSLEVAVDRASVVRAPAGVATVVIGNPLIADATTQKNGVMIVTGKSFGSTNIMLLDGAGAVLSETIVNVRRANDGTMVVQRGAKRESFSCTPRCEPTLAIGDTAESFSQTAGHLPAQRHVLGRTGD